MKNNSVYVSINPINVCGDALNELEIYVSYDKGGYNYYSGGMNRRGVYVHFSPCARIEHDGWISHRTVVDGTMIAGGFKVFLKELGRQSKKQEDYYFNLIEPYKDKFAELWNECNLNEVYNIVQNIIKK